MVYLFTFTLTSMRVSIDLRMKVCLINTIQMTNIANMVEEILNHSNNRLPIKLDFQILPEYRPLKKIPF